MPRSGGGGGGGCGGFGGCGGMKRQVVLCSFGRCLPAPATGQELTWVNRQAFSPSQGFQKDITATQLHGNETKPVNFKP